MDIIGTIGLLRNKGVCEYGDHWVKIAKGKYELKESRWSRFKNLFKNKNK